MTNRSQRNNTRKLILHKIYILYKDEQRKQKIIKCRITKQIQLVLPDLNKRFQLYTDALDRSIGAVLAQDTKEYTKQ